jgi:hypothetical protein
VDPTACLDNVERRKILLLRGHELKIGKQMSKTKNCNR